MPKFLPIVRVPWNPRMSTRRLNEMLATPNIHEDDEDAIMGELWLRAGHLAIAGVPLKTIQELAGHKTISITAQYAHLCPDHKQIEVEKILTAPAPRNVVSIQGATHTAIDSQKKIGKVG
jgi:site-specific recombinase XerC